MSLTDAALAQQNSLTVALRNAHVWAYWRTAPAGSYILGSYPVCAGR